MRTSGGARRRRRDGGGGGDERRCAVKPFERRRSFEAMSAIVSSTRRTSTRTPTPLNPERARGADPGAVGLHIISPSASKALNASTYGEHNFSSAVIAKVFNPTPAKPNNPTPESAASAASPPEARASSRRRPRGAAGRHAVRCCRPSRVTRPNAAHPARRRRDAVERRLARHAGGARRRARGVDARAQPVGRERDLLPVAGGLATGDNLVLERPTLKAQTLREVGGDGVMRYRLSVRCAARSGPSAAATASGPSSAPSSATCCPRRAAWPSRRSTSRSRASPAATTDRRRAARGRASCG